MNKKPLSIFVTAWAHMALYLNDCNFQKALFSKQFLALSVFTNWILEVKGKDRKGRMWSSFQITESGLESFQNYG